MSFIVSMNKQKLTLTEDVHEEQIYLDAAETVYAVFRDRNIPCNIDKFKKNVFGNKVPEYDKYKVRMENNK